jgi:hypothetical protein
MPIKPQVGEFSPYFSKYIDKCPDDILPFLASQLNDFSTLLRNIPANKWDYSYGPGKWTLKQSIIHIIETERIFCYRSLALSRKENTSLPGFDQDLYVENHDSSHLSSQYIIKDFIKTRKLTIHQFNGYSSEQWQYIGQVSGQPIINSALPYMIGGHLAHHISIINERYL